MGCDLLTGVCGHGLPLHLHQLHPLSFKKRNVRNEAAEEFDPLCLFFRCLISNLGSAIVTVSLRLFLHVRLSSLG